MYLPDPDTMAMLARIRSQDLLDEVERERQLRKLKPSLRRRLASGLYALASKFERATARTHPARS